MMAPRTTKRDAVIPVHEANAATGEVTCRDVTRAKRIDTPYGSGLFTGKIKCPGYVRPCQ